MKGKWFFRSRRNKGERFPPKAIEKFGEMPPPPHQSINFELLIRIDTSFDLKLLYLHFWKIRKV